MQAQPKPNVLMFTADQLRFDCLGCYGNSVVQTPNLDRLAARGVRFNNAYTPAAFCVPARQSVLTGLYPAAHGVLSNRAGIPESTQTLGDDFKEAGYQTAAIGKMHFHPIYADYGFTHMRLAEQDGDGWKIDDYHSKFLKARGLVDQWDLWDQQAQYRRDAPARYWQSYGATTSDLSEEHYHTTWIADETISFLEQRERSQPFLAWCSFIKPHHPFDPPVPYDQMYDPADVVLPIDNQLWRDKPLLNLFGDPREQYFDTRDMTEAALRNVVAHYYGLISHVDHHIGRVLDKLEAEGLTDNTIIVFFSDHGDFLGQFGLFLKHPNVPYDALARIPFIMAGPKNKVGEGIAVENLTSLVDLRPTLATLCGFNCSDVQGEDVSSLLRGRADADDERTVLIEAGNGFRAVRSRHHKFIYHPKNHTAELYNVTEDPYETQDIADEQPDHLVRHQQHLLNWLIDSSSERFKLT